MKEIHEFAARLRDTQLNEIECPKAKDAPRNEIWGETASKMEGLKGR
ncbi:MAG: hypothetical protein IJI35_11665 [Kiritimatiellae bacterium]|nr:hypothetical protein [Kiritimatiellia bacterium]MBQ6329665.1 hypothetical protein [Kiritimatiellia bacterium]